MDLDDLFHELKQNLTQLKTLYVDCSLYAKAKLELSPNNVEVIMDSNPPYQDF